MLFVRIRSESASRRGGGVIPAVGLGKPKTFRGRKGTDAFAGSRGHHQNSTRGVSERYSTYHPYEVVHR